MRHICDQSTTGCTRVLETKCVKLSAWQHYIEYANDAEEKVTNPTHVQLWIGLSHVDKMG